MPLFDIILPPDSVVISDVIARQLNAGVEAKSFDIQIADEVGVTDALVKDVIISDTIAVTDKIAAIIIDTLAIANARALTATKVRIDFTAAALDPSGGQNPALTDPSSYTFTAISPGAIDIVPQSVETPPGQTNPLFVEIEVTEHTNGAIYQVAISPLIRGANSEIGGGAPANYAGIGASPIVQLVLATSPTEAVVQFDESILDNASARDVANYVWDNGLSTVSVKSVVGNLVTLETTEQTPGDLYNLTVRGILAVVISDAIQVTDQTSDPGAVPANALTEDGVPLTEDGAFVVET